MGKNMNMKKTEIVDTRGLNNEELKPNIQELSGEELKFVSGGGSPIPGTTTSGNDIVLANGHKLTIVSGG